ncbi:hypothetical protein L9F63_012264, partial [Diploptera punctata]
VIATLFLAPNWTYSSQLKNVGTKSLFSKIRASEASKSTEHPLLKTLLNRYMFQYLSGHSLFLYGKPHMIVFFFYFEKMAENRNRTILQILWTDYRLPQPTY